MTDQTPEQRLSVRDQIGLYLVIVCALLGLSYLLVPAIDGWVVLLLIPVFGCIGFAFVKLMKRFGRSS